MTVKEITSILLGFTEDTEVYFRIPEGFSPGDEISLLKVEYDTTEGTVVFSGHSIS